MCLQLSFLSRLGNEGGRYQLGMFKKVLLPPRLDTSPFSDMKGLSGWIRVD